VAITVKGVSPQELLILLAVDPHLVAEAIAAGVQVFVMANEIRVQSKDASISLSVPVKMQHLLALKQGTLSGLAKQALRMQVQSSIKQVHAAGSASDLVSLGLTDAGGGNVGFYSQTVKPPGYGKGLEPVKVASLGEVAKAFGVGGLPIGPDVAFASAMTLLKKHKDIAETPDTDISDDAAGDKAEGSPTALWSPVSVDAMDLAETVKLRDATHLYQPVSASSSGSRYFLMAGNTNIKLAARYLQSQLSMRVEGANWKKYGTALDSLGFGAHLANGSEYASLHLSVGDHLTAAKCLGAVLLGVGAVFNTSIPNIFLIVNKGK